MNYQFQTSQQSEGLQRRKRSDHRKLVRCMYQWGPAHLTLDQGKMYVVYLMSARYGTWVHQHVNAQYTTRLSEPWCWSCDKTKYDGNPWRNTTRAYDLHLLGIILLCATQWWWVINLDAVLVEKMKIRRCDLDLFSTNRWILVHALEKFPDLYVQKWSKISVLFVRHNNGITGNAKVLNCSPAENNRSLVQSASQNPLACIDPWSTADRTLKAQQVFLYLEMIPA